MGVYPVIAEEFDQVTAVFYNPNIAPEDEYRRRRDTCAEYAAAQGIDFFEICPLDDARMGSRQIGDQGLARCSACYQLRLGRVAAWAIEHDCDAFATTLSISPWQNLEAINRVGEDTQKAFGRLHFAKRDFRAYYREAQKMARSLGVYRQNYCGCLPSKTEADEQRAAKRNIRK